MDAFTASDTTGFQILGGTSGDSLGASVSGAGDVNGDGIDDVIVGAPLEGNKGAAYVIYGSNPPPTAQPTVTPTLMPTLEPSAAPTEAPSVAPTQSPTAAPTAPPSADPTVMPTEEPTAVPSDPPTDEPSVC